MKRDSTHRRRRRRQPDAAAAPDAEQARRVEEAREALGRPRPAAPAPADADADREHGPRLEADALLDEIEGLGADGLARLLEGGGTARFEPGEEVTGTVVRVGGGLVFVDLGAKAEAVIDRAELDATPRPGDRLTAWVLSADEEGIRLARRLSGRAARRALDRAAETGVPVEGRVVERRSGGYAVRVGGVDAFCPASQIDVPPVEDPDAYVGRTLPFKVIEIRGRDVVVAHRPIAEEEARRRAEDLWARLEPDQELEGTVVGVRDFGAFVDVGGVRGLVPRREAGWGPNPKLPPEGSPVRVRVLSVDRAAERLTLTMRLPGEDPLERIAAGEVHEGTVTRVESWGAFVRLDAEAEGLVHVSNLAEGRVGHAAEVVRPGDRVRVRVLSVDRERRRLELGLRQAADAEADGAGGGGRRTAAGTPGFGTLGDLLGRIDVPRR